MTELDEIVMVAKLAYALRDCCWIEDEESRRVSYISIGIDLRDFIFGLRERLDRKAVASETQRRLLMETKRP